RSVADEQPGEAWVAASVGPYGAALGDGSEYRGDYALSVGQLRRGHTFGIQVLADVGPDALALETVPCLTEAEARVEAVRGGARRRRPPGRRLLPGRSGRDHRGGPGRRTARGGSDRGLRPAAQRRAPGAQRIDTGD